MLHQRVKAAAAVVTLVALAGLVGTAVFLAAREDSTPPTTTSTSTTTTTVPPSVAAAAIAERLRDELPAVVTPLEATCIAEVLVDVVEVTRLEVLADAPAPLARLTTPERAQLVRGVVGCVPPERAAALLGSPTTTAAPLELPDEDL